MPELKLVEGRLSEYYDHFSEYRYESCSATETRLMGVVALKICWRARINRKARLVQIVHLDYSEYGVDEYQEYEIIAGTDNYTDRKYEMSYQWDHFVNVMGGRVIEITCDAMIRLVELALPLASDDIDREYDTAENVEFRHYASLRLGMMIESLRADGITSDTCTIRQAIGAVSAHRLSTCETINYFLMRLVDHDYDAASCLTAMDRGSLERIELTAPGIQTLIRTRIRMSSTENDAPADGTSVPYRVRVTTLSRGGYYHSSLVIYLDGSYKVKDPLVTDVQVGSTVKLSDFEAALEVTRKEYITVFQCPDNILEGFNGNMITTLQGVDPDPVPNGWLYTVYKKDNAHVNKMEYRLGDDVYGYALLTVGGQLILMSHEMTNITTLDNAVLFSVYSPYLKPAGRYLLEKIPVFHTLCHTGGAMFEDFIVPAADN